MSDCHACVPKHPLHQHQDVGHYGVQARSALNTLPTAGRHAVQGSARNDI